MLYKESTSHPSSMEMCYMGVNKLRLPYIWLIWDTLSVHTAENACLMRMNGGSSTGVSVQKKLHQYMNMSYQLSFSIYPRPFLHIRQQFSRLSILIEDTLPPQLHMNDEPD